MVGRFQPRPSVIILFIVFNNSAYTTSIVTQLAITETLLITAVGPVKDGTKLRASLSMFPFYIDIVLTVDVEDGPSFGASG